MTSRCPESNRCPTLQWINDDSFTCTNSETCPQSAARIHSHGKQGQPVDQSSIIWRRKRESGNQLGEPGGWGGHGLVTGALRGCWDHEGGHFLLRVRAPASPGVSGRYEDDLKKMLPHIPRATGFHTYASVGHELADLHVNYERVEPYPSVQEEASLHAPADPWERYRIGERKMRFPKLGRRDKDFTRLEYNDYVTLTGIPAEAQGYSISGRSPLEWIIDRYHVKTDKASGIVNDPNDFLREQGRPDAVVDLIKRLVTVSMRTQELLATLPKLEIPEGA